MPEIYGPQPLKPLNTVMRHGFEEQYQSDQLLQSLANDFIFYFDDKRHKTNGNPIPEEDKQRDVNRYYQPITDWKIMKDRQKTVSAALLLCLNLGVDPPDVMKTHPCARVEAWVDPLNFQDSKKAIEQIGKNLQAQYETLSLRTRYKQSLDPCVEDVKRFCNSLRRTSKEDRILFHYNGHGVPKPTKSGEIWVFNRGYTQYIPVSLYDLQTWLGAPCIFVYDCNSAENILINFQKFVQKRIKDDEEGNHDVAAPSPTSAYQDCFQLASCTSDELLLMSPELPADLFSCCLTCPIEISIRIFLMQSPLKDSKYKIFFENSTSNQPFGDSKNSFKSKIPNVNIPGMLSDRRTPLGELNWIFTAITDTIAWTSLPRPLFKKLFRHDLMIAALFRNFLLAKRIMPWYNCHPVSDPELPDSITTHPMWKSWDLAMDEVLTKIVIDLKNAPPATALESQMILQQQETLQNGGSSKSNAQDTKAGSIQTQSRFAVANLSTMSLVNNPALQSRKSISLQSSQQQLQQQQQQQQQFTGFFEQNLTAFELWLKYASNVRHPPEQLPIVLQVLLSQVHRIRALVLLSRFLDLGPWAVYLSLSIGIFPYVLKLLQSPAPELKPILVFIWARIMSIDYKNTQSELIKEKGYMYFVTVLVPDWGVNGISATNGSAMINSGNPLTMTASQNINGPSSRYYERQQGNRTSNLGHNNLPFYHSNDTTDEQKAMAVFVLASFVRNFPLGQKNCFSLELVNKLCFYIDNSEIPLLRQWCVILLGLLFADNPLNRFVCMNTGAVEILLKSLKDPVPEVRTASIFALKHFISGFQDAEVILRLQQEFEEQYQQLHSQLQHLQNQSHLQQQQSQQQQQHLEQQQMKIEKQIRHCQVMQNQLEVIDLRKLKRQEIGNLISILPLINDGSSLVRKELVVYFSHIVSRYSNFFIVVVFNDLLEEIKLLEKSDINTQNTSDKYSVSHSSIFYTVWKSLLILAEDPFLENKELSKQVIDYILLELSAHKELGGPFAVMEKFLLKRSSKAHQTGKFGFNSSQVQFVKSSLRSFSPNERVDNNAPKKEQQQHDPKISHPMRTSLAKLFQSLGFSESNSDSDTQSSNTSMKSHTSKKGPSGLYLLNGNNNIYPTAETPRFRKHTEPLQLPLNSSFLDYSREYFQEPQMKKQEADEPGSVEYNARLWRRNRNETIIQETQGEKKLSIYGNWSKKLISLNNKSQPKLMKFAQFEDQLITADDRSTITVFDWEKGKTLSKFSNGTPFGTKVTDLKLINEDDSALLLTGSSDGVIKIYRDYQDVDTFKIVSAWRGLTDMLLTPRSTGLLTEWLQIRGSLLTTGDVKVIRVWDAHTETVEVDIPAKTSSLITSLTADQLAGNIFVAGFADGSLRVYDRRLDPRDSMIRRWRAGNDKQGVWINNVHLQRGGYRELVSGATNGVVELWDIRSEDPVESFVDQNVTSQYGSQQKPTTMTCMQVHEHAPIIATGTKQIKIWTTSGDLLNSFKNSHNNGVTSTLAATGIPKSLSYSSTSDAFLSSMAFHPHRMMIAATNSHDSIVNIYKCEDERIDYF